MADASSRNAALTGNAGGILPETIPDTLKPIGILIGAKDRTKAIDHGPAR